MTKSQSILIVEDEPSVADALKLILEDCGYMVAWAPTGVEGVGLAQSGRFRLVVTDLGLPDISGLEVLSAARQAQPPPVVVLITTNGTPEAVRDAHARGAACVVLKPFPPSDIIRLVEQTLGETCSCQL
jgi:CheY-like chemotaxis protein